MDTNTIKSIEKDSIVLNDILQDEIEKSQKFQDIQSSKDIKSINEEFKNENFDGMTRAKYRRFREEYRNGYNRIYNRQQKELDELEENFKLDYNKLNINLDEVVRNEQRSKLRCIYYINRNKIYKKYRKKIFDFKYDFRYRMTQLGLKWKYISCTNLNI